MADLDEAAGHSDEAYGESYFTSHCGSLVYGRDEPHWSRFFGAVADKILLGLRPDTVFDAGCAHGFLVEALWDRNVPTWGRDISRFAVSQVRTDLRSFVSQGSIAEPIDGRYDLVTCIEVLEHMEEADAVKAISAVTAAAPRVLFSSSPTDLEESTHVNVKPVIWWLERFADVGYAPVFSFDASFLTAHAYLLEKSDSGRGRTELLAFAELIRLRISNQNHAHEVGSAHQEIERLNRLIEDSSLRLKEANQTAARAIEEAEADAVRAQRQLALSLDDAEQARRREGVAQVAYGAAIAERALLEAELIKVSVKQSDAAAAMRLADERNNKVLAENGRLLLALEHARADLAAASDRELAVTLERRAAEHERDRVIYSSTWRATKPIREFGAALPAPARRAIRQTARTVFRIITPQSANKSFERQARLSVELSEGILARQAEAPAIAAVTTLLPPAAEARPETDYDRWVREVDTLNDHDRTLIREHACSLKLKPLISVIMPSYDASEELLRAAISSVRAQLYPHWELCVADDASPSDTVVRVMRELAAEEPRIKWLRRDVNGHIAAATNSALTLATGEFLALLDHDDILAEQALYEVAVAINNRPDANLIYSDEDHIDEDGRRANPYFKPDYNIDLLLGHNLISHLGVYRRSLVEKLGGLRENLVDGSQDYDLALRACAVSEADTIVHIPAILYHWRRTDRPSSFSQARLDECVAAARVAIADYLQSQHIDAEVVPAPATPLWSRVRRSLPAVVPKVSIVVPTKDKADLLARCVGGLLHRTDYDDLEVLIVDNGSSDPDALALLQRLRLDSRVRVISYEGAFNYSAINNHAVGVSTGDVILMLNNDVDVIAPSWLTEMVSLVMRPDVGAVGAKLYYADKRIQHAGVVLGVGNHEGGPGVAGHFGHFEDSSSIGYFGQYCLTKEVSGVTGACLAIRRETFDAVGGLDEVNLPVSFNDVDLCMKIRSHGLRVIWTPFAELFHLESASRGTDATPSQVERAAAEASHMRRKWGPLLDTDPFYNINFDRLDHTFRLAFPPRRLAPWRHQTMVVNLGK